MKVKLNERKPADKVEPKFNAGDWIVYNDDLYHIGNIALRGYYECLRIDGTVHTFSLDIDSKSHLWTIQDAKDGDVIAWDDSKCIALFKEIYDNDSFKSYGLVGACTGVFEDGGFHDIEDAHPATQEQCDLLFSKMKEAGYGWDVEKKELKKIEQKPTNKIEPIFKVGDMISNGTSEVEIIEVNDNSYSVTNDEIENDCNLSNWVVYFKDQDNWELIEQNSAWSEEDDIEISVLINVLGEFETHRGDFTKEKNWLKTLKDRVQSQPKKELNEDAVNEYVDLGLPSGTLWKAFNEEGYCTYDEVLNKFDNRLPSKEQWKELKDECEWEWKDNGYDVTGPNGNMIFLPAVGYRDCTGLNLVGRYGYYWSSTGAGDKGAWCMKFDDGGFNYLSKENRCIGFSVRLVK